ncbi:MAG TPA: GDSL-type esterase/lipase family protein, partial [Streptosporangiaceae bacterium]|nr:GDSL-type esterase/lipase family protein [Streptosporangiaceae bacterium]
RIRVSNVFGTAPLQVAQATVALPAAPGRADVAAGTLREVTFGGAASVTIPAGHDVLSDPVRLTVPANHDLLVTTYTPGNPTPFTFHPDAQQTSYYASGSDQADATSAGAFPQTTGSWYLLTGVEVDGTAARGDVVAFGDSITDGYASTPNLNARWPNILADRLLALPPHDQLGVLNAGIGGNRILLDGGNGFGPPALTRFGRDVLGQPAVRSVIILEGINDIQQTPHQLDATKIIAGLQQLIDMAHSRGIRVIGGTLTPFEGWYTYDQQQEQTREAVNYWIRTSHAYDAVVDFDAVVRDPADPHRFRPAYDSGDHLHPNDAGYMAMGAAVKLADLGTDVPPGQAGPVVRALSPDPAAAGQTVTVRGSGFGNRRGAGYVAVSDMGTYWGAPGNAATLTIGSWSDRSITFTVPQPSGPGGVWRVSAGTTATVNVVDAAGAVSATAPLDITPTASLADYYDNAGVTPDSNQVCADLDGDGFSYSQQTLTAAGLTPGATVTSAGLSYTWPAAAACSPDNVLADAQTILVHGPHGASTLGLLGSSTSGGSQGALLIHYSDGTTSPATVSFGDWAGAPVTGDRAVATLPYRNSHSGTSNQLTVYVFATQIPVDPGRTVVSVTLPEVGHRVAPSVTAMHIFALALGS